MFHFSYCALEASVFGFVDDAHAASAETFEDLVMGYGLADHGKALDPGAARVW